MIATALKIQGAPKEAVYSELTTTLASELVLAKDVLDTDTFQKMLFQYSATLSSLTAALVTEAILTDEQMSDMIEAINELEQIEKDVM